MTWYPPAIVKEVTRHRTPMVARRFVFHTAVSASSSLFPFFNQPGNATSHFYVRADGTVEQYVDTQFRAPAQLDGNHDCISVETQDMGDGFPAWSGSDVPAWNGAQLAALAQLAAWVSQTHGISLVQLPDSINGRTGFGYHRQGINPWRVPNGELWSNSYGKVCCGDRRIAQIPEILQRALQGDDMTPEEHNWLAATFENAAEARRLSGEASSHATGAEEHAGEARRIAGVLAGALPESGSEKSVRTQVDAALADLTSIVTTVSDADLVRIAIATADEQARRQVS